MDIGKLCTMIGCDWKEILKVCGMLFPEADPEALTYQECFYISLHFLKEGEKTDEG